ncbi:immunoglobulin superfamily DCC subclass member 3-like [Oscarella lobularis]|uniref:immunoglobulin superfamily DCC subclass member 3-like n=1 Tax=Oscarella lobularis TaxID=121494 RepID=UPI003313C5D5
MKSCIVQLLFYFTIETGSSTVKILFASSDRLLPGQDASLLCSVIGSITFQITRWEKGGTALNLNDSRYTSNPKLTSLGIHKVTKTDTGLYRCVATIDGAEKSGAKYLAVLVNPEISFNPLTVAAEGDSVTLGCPGTYFTTIEWTFNGVNMSRKPGYTYSKNNAYLTIDRVSRTQAGQYVCTAINYYPNHAKTDAPEAVVHGPSNGSVIQDNPVYLYCNASGVPPPRIRWEKDGVLVSDLGSSRYKIESEGKALSIDGVLTSDTSNITCIANNSMGASSDYCELRVEGPPSPPELIGVSITVTTIPSHRISMFANWTIPFDGNSPINGYVLHYREKEDARWSVTPTRETENFKAIDIGVVDESDIIGYEFYVTAENLRGASKRSRIVQASRKDFIFITPPTSSPPPPPPPPGNF